jgi:hypothetical protein
MLVYYVIRQAEDIGAERVLCAVDIVLYKRVCIVSVLFRFLT